MLKASASGNIKLPSPGHHYGGLEAAGLHATMEQPIEAQG